MKKMFRSLALALALCVALSSLPHTALAAGTTHEYAGDDLRGFIDSAAVSDGDTVRLSQECLVNDGTTDNPWIINKSITIEGGGVWLGTGGILLGADVTFKNTTLSFSSSIRNAVIANGHRLTLDNVTCGNQSYNLFCGSLINSNGESFVTPTPGDRGELIIKGDTSLQKNTSYGKGNIYAGNLTMGGMNEEHNGSGDNGPANNFDGDAVIDLSASTAGSGAFGTIYACGGQQRIPVGQTGGKVTMPGANIYTVSGSVTITGTAPDVMGTGAPRVDVTFISDTNEIEREFFSISSLTVQSGKLRLKSGSSFKTNDGGLGVSSGAKLYLSGLTGDLSFGSLTGGGILILSQNQTVGFSGAVTGTTGIAVGDAAYGDIHSTSVPTPGHTYITAPLSPSDSFKLLPYATRPDSEFIRDDKGGWTVSGGEQSDDKIVSIAFNSSSYKADSLDVEGVMEMTSVTDPSVGVYLDFFPLTINVNGYEASRTENEGYYTYTSRLGELSMEIIEGQLCVTPHEKGVYNIEIVVPGEYTSSGSILRASAALTVGDATAPEHIHSWSGDWKSNKTHHWHECAAEGCTITDPALKDGYAAHTESDWITDKTATATQAGSRHKACTVCSFVTVTEEIPATGGGTGGSGGSGGSGGTGGSGSSGGSGGGGVGGQTKPPVTEDKNEKPVSDPTLVYTDIPEGAWYGQAVGFVTDMKLMTGSDGAFEPEAPMTRAMLMTVLARLDGQDTSGGTAWYEKGVTWAIEKGISDGSQPHDNITREQLAAMLYRHAGSPAVTGATYFDDSPDISPYALDAVKWANENGILLGYTDRMLLPGRNATRAEMAAILMRYISLTEK